MSGVDRFREKYGPWAIVAGAGEGLGAAFARALAARGLDLLLIDRRANLVAALAASLGQQHAVRAEAVVLDLASADVLERVADAADGQAVGLLVCNAAASLLGEYLERTTEEHREILAVNCLAPALLVHHFGRRMRARGRGGILLMSSLSAFRAARISRTTQPRRRMPSCSPRVVGRVSPVQRRRARLLPRRHPRRAIATPPRERGRWEPPEMEPEAVVREALAALGRRPHVIPGRANRWAAFLMQRVLSRVQAVRAMGRVGRGLRASAQPKGT
jgi:hypothetical protein